MKKIIVWGMCVLAGLSLCSCVSKDRVEQANFEAARTLLLEGKAECVLIQDGEVVHAEKGRGVSPLLRLYKAHKNEMAGGFIVDKVIGRAAAAIAINGKVRKVHGEVMSEDGKAFLEKHGIETSHTLLVPRILNRDRSGLCPLEKSVEGCNDPVLAQKKLEEKIREMMSRKK